MEGLNVRKEAQRIKEHISGRKSENSEAIKEIHNLKMSSNSKKAATRIQQLFAWRQGKFDNKRKEKIDTKIYFGYC